MNWTVSIAESMTGGAVSARLVSVPGASTYFQGGVVSYSDRSKEEILGVPASLIAEYGVVSPEVAIAMAQGVKKRFHTEIAIGITGYAGPKGANVGICFVGIIFQEHQDCKKLEFEGKSRGEIIQNVTDWVVEQIEILRNS